MLPLCILGWWGNYWKIVKHKHEESHDCVDGYITNTNGKITEGIMVTNSIGGAETFNMTEDIGRNLFRRPSWVALLFHLRILILAHHQCLILTSWALLYKILQLPDFMKMYYIYRHTCMQLFNFGMYLKVYRILSFKNRSNNCFSLYNSIFVYYYI